MIFKKFSKKKFLSLLNFIILFFLLQTDVLADTLHFLVERNLPKQLGNFRHVQFIFTQGLPVVDVYAVILNDSYQAALYLQPAKTAADAQSLYAVSRSKQALIAINGGYYSPSFMPIGLFISQGHLVRPLSKSHLLNACITINKKGQLFLSARQSTCPIDNEAMQVGPLLINQGVSENIEKLALSAPVLKSFFMPHQRTVLAESSEGKKILLVTSRATLSQIISILINHPTALGVPAIKTAVNLDGGPSTGMVVNFDSYPFYFPEKKPVKAMVLYSNQGG